MTEKCGNRITRFSLVSAYLKEAGIASGDVEEKIRQVIQSHADWYDSAEDVLIVFDDASDTSNVCNAIKDIKNILLHDFGPEKKANFYQDIAQGLFDL